MHIAQRYTYSQLLSCSLLAILLGECVLEILKHLYINLFQILEQLIVITFNLKDCTLAPRFSICKLVHYSRNKKLRVSIPEHLIPPFRVSIVTQITINLARGQRRYCKSTKMANKKYFRSLTRNRHLNGLLNLMNNYC